MRSAEVLRRPAVCSRLLTAARFCCAVRRPREQAEESDLFNYIVEQGAQMAKALGRSGQVQPGPAEQRSLPSCAQMLKSERDTLVLQRLALTSDSTCRPGRQETSSERC